MAAVAATLQRAGLTNEPGCRFCLVMGALQPQPLRTEARKALQLWQDSEPSHAACRATSTLLLAQRSFACPLSELQTFSLL